MLTKIKQKYLETKNLEVITLAIQAATLTTFLGLIHTVFKLKTYNFIVALMGVLVISLLQTIALRGPVERRLRYTFWASIITGCGMALGSYCGHSFWLTSIWLLVLIPLVAFTSAADHLIACTVLFTADLFIVGSGMPMPTGGAIIYGIFFTIGGLLTWLTSYFWYRRHPIAKANFLHYKKLTLARIFMNADKNVRFAMVLTIAVIIGNAISYVFHLPQGYWVPMTAMLILKSDFDFSKKRINHRLYGTLLGSVFAFVLIMLVSSKITLSLLMFPLMILMVVALAKHYGAYTFFLTIAVTVMMNLIEPDGYLITEHRIIGTVLGVLAVVLVIWFVKPKLTVNKN